jgi:hypothetical protein
MNKKLKCTVENIYKEYIRMNLLNLPHRRLTFAMSEFQRYLDNNRSILDAYSRGLNICDMKLLQSSL